MDPAFLAERGLTESQLPFLMLIDYHSQLYWKSIVYVYPAEECQNHQFNTVLSSPDEILQFVDRYFQQELIPFQKVENIEESYRRYPALKDLFLEISVVKINS